MKGTGRSSRRIRAGARWFRVGLLAALLPAVVWAQQATPPVAAPALRQETVTEELVRMLAKHNALSKADAKTLLKRLQAEQAPQTAVAAQPATAPTAATPPETTAAAPATAAPGAAKGPVRVIYIPESEKEKIRQEVKQDVIAQAKAENWAQPFKFPDWAKRISLAGDFRFRQEFDEFDSTNSPYFINYQAINSGAPYDVNSTTFPPLLNTTEDRELPRFRARLNLDAKVADDLSVGFRFASGNTTNPVSTNQTLGTDFNKTSFTIDQAYADYRPIKGLDVYAGRIPNPWQSTALVWWPDLSFDGGAIRYTEDSFGSVKPFATIGAFSVENTAFDFPSYTYSKLASRDKWLFAAQLGADWSIGPALKAKAAVAYYYFYHLQGKLSSPCVALSASDSCDSDDSRPGFIQKGNALFAIRDLQELASDPTGPQYQYFGLASPFHIIDVNAQVDYRLRGPLHLILDADVADNIAWNYNRVSALNPVNDYGAGTNSPYDGGNKAYFGQLTFGFPTIVERWNWNVSGGYRYTETDAVVDAFNDPDFHIGGTNAKGYFVGANLGFTHNAWANLRYLSAQQVTGVPLAVDVIQIDLNARF